ncbi:zinc finger protein 346 isoform X4 [Peromyscus eremicus]|uniref:zinc finger protein 346 isoform X4 n=1 Tax=Peromyscus eremicus TaxID=42410 RepID=UPI0027DB1937|nr:zinc finger protein 346 isoform X4 [Peromyscus eremicus]
MRSSSTARLAGKMECPTPSATEAADPGGAGPYNSSEEQEGREPDGVRFDRERARRLLEAVSGAQPAGREEALHQNREMLDPDKFCSLCHSTFNDPAMAQQHYMGKRHRKQETKLKLMAHYGRLADPAVSDFPAGKGYPCKTCKIVLNSIEQYQAHVSGFKHKNQSPRTVVSPVSRMPVQTQPTPKDSSVVGD